MSRKILHITLYRFLSPSLLAVGVDDINDNHLNKEADELLNIKYTTVEHDCHKPVQITLAKKQSILLLFITLW